MVNFTTSIVALSTWTASGDRVMHISNTYKPNPDATGVDIAAIVTKFNSETLYFFRSTVEYGTITNGLVCNTVWTGTVEGSLTRNVFNINKWITANGEYGNFTRDYNAAFGTEYTQAEVFAALQSIYGVEYKWFAISSHSGAMFSKQGITGVSSYSLYDDPNELQAGCDYCDSWTYSSIDPDYVQCFTGVSKGIDPDYLSNIGDSGTLLAYYFLGTPDYVPDKLRFNVYIDGVIGQKGPNIAINWTNTNENSTLSDLLVKPHVFGYAVVGFPEGGGEPSLLADLKEEEGIIVPYWTAANRNLPLDTQYDWSGEYSNSYVGEVQNLTDMYNTLEKVTLYGLDGVPNYIRYFLRFDYEADGETLWGDLYYVNVPYNYEGAAYITAVKVTGGDNDAPYQTEVIIVGGTPPEEVEDDPDEPEQGYDDNGDESADGPYPDPDDQPDISDYDSEGFPGDAVLTKTYKLTKERLQNIGATLWSQTYFDVLKIQTNPIENIIACRWYPMDLTGGTEVGVKIGDVAMGVNGVPIPTVYSKTIGSYTYKGVISENGKNLSPGYLAQSPYTIIKLHLPYVGTVQLDASEIYDRQLHVQYVVDIVTGDILVLLKLGSHKLPYMSLSGKMGVDIPLSGSDRAQVQIAAAARAATALIGGAGHVLEGNAGAAVGSLSGILSMAGMDYSTQRVIQHSSVCASYDNRAVVLEMQVNKTSVSAGYKKYHGLPSHQYATLKKGMGFIQVSRRTIIDVAMTDEENRMLESIMTQGCYF